MSTTILDISIVTPCIYLVTLSFKNMHCSWEYAGQMSLSDTNRGVKAHLVKKYKMYAVYQVP